MMILLTLLGLVLGAASVRSQTTITTCRDIEATTDFSISELGGDWQTKEAFLYSYTSLSLPRSVIPRAHDICVNTRLSPSVSDFKMTTEYFINGVSARKDSVTILPKSYNKGHSAMASQSYSLQNYETKLIAVDTSKYMAIALCKPPRIESPKIGQRPLDIVSVSVRRGVTLSDTQVTDIRNKIINAVGNSHYRILQLGRSC